MTTETPDLAAILQGRAPGNPADVVVQLIREELAQSRTDLDLHVLGTPLSSLPACAELHMLQGRIKCCDDLLKKVVALRAWKPPA